MVGLSFEKVAIIQVSADCFLTDLALSPESLCKRGGLWVWTLARERLLLMDSSERRRAELAVDVLEPCFPPREWRSRAS